MSGARHRRAVVILAAPLVLALVMAGCAGGDQTAPASSTGQPGTGAGAETSDDDGAGTGSPRVVDACPDPVEGFAVSVDADGNRLEGPDSTGAGDREQPDPHQITGQTTAEIADENVYPVVEDPSPQLPVVVESCDGETVEITDTSRIIAVDLYGTLGEIVFSLGMGDSVVGRDRSTGFPQAEDVPMVTPSAHDLNAEAILELNPSVVLTDASIGPPEVQQQLRDAGVPVVFFDDARTIDRVPGQIRAVAGTLGVPEAGEALIDRTEGQIAEAMMLAPDSGEPLRIAFLYTRGGMVQLLAGPGSGADAMIRAIGGVDVGTDIGLDRPFTQITSEALIEAEPDLILMMTEGLNSIGGADGLTKIPGVAQMPAGEKLRVVDMADTQLLSFGPRTGQTIAALAEAIYAP